jgi:hypothetical protein
MFTRFLVMSLFAAALTACGDAADFTKKIINSDNGEPLILFASATYETAASFLNIGDLQVVDGTGFCKEVDGVIGTATVPPAAPAPGEDFVIAFGNCVDEYGITYNNSIRVTISAFTDWSNLAFTLEFIDLTAESDWLGGDAMVGGSLDYVVAGEAGTVDLPFDTLTTEVSTGMMGQLQLDALNITVELDAENPEITETSVDGSGELSNTDFSAPLAVTLRTSSVLRLDTANVDLLCPQTGALRLTATEDSSYASLEYPSGTNNVYQVRTNGSFIEQYDCI